MKTEGRQTPIEDAASFEVRVASARPSCMVEAAEGFAPVAGGKLWYRDTGGQGPAVVLLHPVTGSALIWDYQMEVLRRAGYRVIAYSRRGHYGSDPAPAGQISHPVLDLAALLDHLRIATCALLAGAAGCSVALDFTISHSARLKCVIFSCGSFSGVDEPSYKAMGRRVMSEGFESMPPEFRELGPSYRAANPEGVSAWLELLRKARSGETAGARRLNDATWDNITSISVPTLFIAGGADLYAPPPQVREVAARIRGAKLAVLWDCGHSPHWEAPDEFNAVVVSYMRQHMPP